MKSNPSVLHRFNGKEGRERLIEALGRQVLVAGNLEIARRIRRYAQVLELNPNQDFIFQGGTDSDIYFILSGRVSIIVNEREIAVRSADEHVGEMALIDTTARRSSTVRALEPCVVVKICERHFTKIAKKYPELWRKIAVVLARRLNERNKFQTAPRSEPVIFIGSSSEGHEVAEAIDCNLKKFPCVPNLWSRGVFEASKTTIEELYRAAEEADFAVIVFTPDDITKSRRKSKPAPRDNVIFELGLFMGAIARERTYIVIPKDIDIKIPTDVLGLTCLRYDCSPPKSLGKRLQPVCKKIRDQIKKYGPV